MGTYLALYDKTEVVAKLEWNDNPFGLGEWAEDNCGFENIPSTERLTYVTGFSFAGHSLPTAAARRAQLLEVVRKYWARLQIVDHTFFFFTFPEFREHVERLERTMPKETVWGAEITRGHFQTRGDRMEASMGFGRTVPINKEYAFPVENFTDPGFPFRTPPTTDKYMVWFAKLVAFAEQAQDMELRFVNGR